jgi:hypothetical protein
VKGKGEKRAFISVVEHHIFASLLLFSFNFFPLSLFLIFLSFFLLLAVVVDVDMEQKQGTTSLFIA